jgi:hypothetical protein
MINNNENQQKKKRLSILLILILLLAISLVCLLVWQGFKQPEMSKTQESPLLLQTSGELKVGKDLTLVSGGGDISVFIPACAIQQKGSVVLTPRGPYVNEDLPDNVFTRPRTAMVEYYDKNNILIPDLYVACPIMVCFKLTDDEWTRFTKTPTDFEVQFLDISITPNLWRKLSMVIETEKKTICGNNTRLGLFALAIKGLPVPETGGGIYAPDEPTVTPTESGIYVP